MLGKLDKLCKNKLQFISSLFDNIVKQGIKEKQLVGDSIMALKIAECLLAIAQEAGDCITNLRLQKLLYYAQAWYLVNHNEKLFDEPIEAWKFGPVVKVVYDKYKNYGYKPITDINEQACDCLDDEQKTYLYEFAEYFFGYSATELVSMTHNEKPWKEAYNAETPNAVISTESMKEYYSKLVA